MTQKSQKWPYTFQTKSPEGRCSWKNIVYGSLKSEDNINFHNCCEKTFTCNFMWYLSIFVWNRQTDLVSGEINLVHKISTLKNYGLYTWFFANTSTQTLKEENDLKSVFPFLSSTGSFILQSLKIHDYTSLILWTEILFGGQLRLCHWQDVPQNRVMFLGCQHRFRVNILHFLCKFRVVFSLQSADFGSHLKISDRIWVKILISLNFVDKTKRPWIISG